VSQRHRFGLEEVERQQQLLQDAKKPAPPPQDNFSHLGQMLINLPWVLLAVTFIIWWLKK